MEKMLKICCLISGFILISCGQKSKVVRTEVDYCPFGQPLPGLFCGRGPTRQPCPTGTYCEISPVDAYAVCCPVFCTFGLPKQKGKKVKKRIITCDKKEKRCGRKFICSTIQHYEEKVCCPRKPKRKMKAKKD